MPMVRRDEFKLNLDNLKSLSWERKDIETEVNLELYDFYFPKFFSGTTKSEKLFELATKPGSPSLYVIYGALRAILQSRTLENDKKHSLSVYVFAIDSPDILPDCTVYKKNKYHIIEFDIMNSAEKYSYFETEELFIVFRHKLKESDSCFLFLYRK